jgi:hypothetical protein
MARNLLNIKFVTFFKVTISCYLVMQKDICIVAFSSSGLDQGVSC